MIAALMAKNWNVVLLTTKSARFFTDQEEYWVPEEKLDDIEAPLFCSFKDEDEYTTWCKEGDPVLHISLIRLADCMLIAPMSANSLGKITSGIADNIILQVFKGWPYRKEENGEWLIKKACIIAPAMNTAMLENPTTEKLLKIASEQMLLTVMPTQKKVLMCGGAAGYGAMASVEDMVEQVGLGIQRLVDRRAKDKELLDAAAA